MVDTLSIQDFLITPGTILDVRSPSEFSQARIVNAVNLPLFNDQEHAAVGTLFKKQGKEAAIQLGLKLVAPKLESIVDQAKTHTTHRLAKVHCWRGGMRSSAMAWLLDYAGISSVQLQGGYKAFRKWVLEQFQQQYKFLIIGGKTGCGKTAILNTLKEAGEQVINLECLAQHRGSTYGLLGMDPQPSNEQFENDLAMHLAVMDRQKTIWIEDESRCIGSCFIPNPIFNQLSKSPFILVETPLEKRIDRLLAEYGTATAENLIQASMRISKRLGGQRTKELIDAIQQHRLREAIAIVLHYYDSAYNYSLTRRAPPMMTIHGDSIILQALISIDNMPK